LSGHWNNSVGVVHQNSWITSNGYANKDAWLFAIEQQNELYRRGDGNDWQYITASTGDMTGQKLAINRGGSGSEKSDFNIAEVLIFNRSLSSSEIEQIKTYLQNKYDDFYQANSRPVITSEAPELAYENNLYHFFIQAEDYDGDAITISITEPANATLIGNLGQGTALMEWTPTKDDIGQQLIQIQLTDSAGSESTVTFNVTVINTVNDAPYKILLPTIEPDDVEMYRFTNAYSAVYEGPTQFHVDSAYSGTTLENSITINTRGIQEWTVPNTAITSSRQPVDRVVMASRIIPQHRITMVEWVRKWWVNLP